MKSHKKPVAHRKRRKPFKHIYLQSWGTYSDETVVAVGASHEDILAWAKKIKAKPWIIKEIEEGKKKLEEYMDGRGCFIEMTGPTGRATILWLRKWDRSLEDVSVLVHELSHAIDLVLVKALCMGDETEAKAYQLQFLYLAVLRELDRMWYPSVTVRKK